MSNEQYLDTICNQFDKLREHHFVSKSQASYLQFVKEQLTPNNALILLDFAENYSFIVQDAIQSYHWNNSQATLHPFVVYFREINCETLRCKIRVTALYLTVYNIVLMQCIHLAAESCIC